MSRGQEFRRTGSLTPCGQCSPYISRSRLRTLVKAIADFWAYRNAGRTADQQDLVAPTSAGLRAFCSWHPDFAVTPAEGGDCIRSTIDLDFTSELGVEAAMLVELIRSAPVYRD